jgi:nitrite reductase (NADH) large subunit
MNMAGRKAVYAGSMGRNVIRVFGLDVLTGGMVNPVDERNYRIVSDFDRTRKFYRKIVLLEDRPVGLAMVGGIEQGGILLAMMQQGRSLSVNPENLLSPRFNYRLLMR